MSSKSTWIKKALAEDPDRVLRVDPDNREELLIITENWDGLHPYGRNTRPTPSIGDKSLSELIANMEDQTNEDLGDFGQLQPSCAVLNDDGVLELYFGFRRARAIQTRNVERRKAGMVPIKLKVIVTDRPLTEDELTRRSLAENSFRLDPTPMQISELVCSLQATGQGVAEIGRQLGKSVGAISTYSRFSLLPPNAKKLLNTGKMQYSGGENLVSMLPKAAELKADEDGSVLAAAQTKIAKVVDKLTEKGGGAVKSADAAQEGRAAGNVKQRKVKEIIVEIAAQLESEEAGSMVGKRLTAFEKFVNGGGMKALVKALA